MGANSAEIRRTTSKLTPADRWDHFLARWGVNRLGHRVEPGLYALSTPGPDSPVFVTANYTLSFDALRSALDGVSAYILVLDTEGVNVWCAAGKGTFGTDELVRRIDLSALGRVVSHRRLILPQLGAPGVSAHEVQPRSGFRVEYGPVRAADLPAYLATGKATPEMRQVTFWLRDRAVLIPVELRHVFLPTVVAASVLYFTAGALAAWGAVAAVLAGVVAFPILLPWLPTRDFSTKGFILGALVALPFARAMARHGAGLWFGIASAGALALVMIPVTSFLALNFTGSTPFTSRTGVRWEIYRYVQVMAAMALSGIMLAVIVLVISLIRG